MVTIAKSRGIFIILGLLFGTIGLHDFYAGYNVRGVIKLALMGVGFMMDASTNFYSGFVFVAVGIAGIWTLIELFVTKEDKAGNAMG